MTVVGTRPEIIRLSRVIAALECHLQHVLVHTGQNYDYELNQVFFDDLEMRAPDYFWARLENLRPKPLAWSLQEWMKCWPLRSPTRS